MAPQANKIERTRKYLMESSLHEDTKATLDSLLDAAMLTERSVDLNDMTKALAQAVTALAVHEVRQAVNTPDVMQGAIDRHVADLHKQCIQLPQTKTEIFVFLLSRPWPWVTIAVGVFSPHAAHIVEVVSGLFVK